MKSEVKDTRFDYFLFSPFPFFIKLRLMNNSCKSPKSPAEALLLLWKGGGG
jgi:hypothetical protein